MEVFQIYLAGASLHAEDEGRQWREKAVQIFEQQKDEYSYKVRVVNPIEYFSYSEAKHQSDSQIKNYYMDQVLHSRLILVNLNDSDKSIGTAQELQFARDHEIAIIGFGTENIYNWLKVDCQCIFPSMLQAIDYITEYYLK